jgi:DNA-binding response OmpR family regulator
MTTLLEVRSEKAVLRQTQNYANPPRRILLVDDDPRLLELHTGVLISSGYKVDTAVNGADAWKALNSISYDLLITDNRMPRVTGLELIKKLRSEEMTLPVILASGTVPKEELKQHPSLQLDATLPKPFPVAELLDMVEKVLHAADNFANSAQLFRDCAMLDDRVSQAENPGSTPIREQLNLSYRILVVDDDNNTRQQSVNVLVGSGYDVEGVKDGAAGWDALQASDYDLVVTDNKMPKMTGIEMIAKLRSARMVVPVIMATGLLPTEEFIRKPWLKPDATLQRPFTNDELLETVRNVLRTDDGNEGGKETLLPRYL